MQRSSLKRNEKHGKKPLCIGGRSRCFDSADAEVQDTFREIKDLDRQFKAARPRPKWPKFVLPVLLILLLIGTGLFMLSPVFTGLSVKNLTEIGENLTYELNISNVSGPALDETQFNLSNLSGSSSDVSNLSQTDTEENLSRTVPDISENDSLPAVPLDVSVPAANLSQQPVRPGRHVRELMNEYHGLAQRFNLSVEGVESIGRAKQRFRKAVLARPIRPVRQIEFRDLEVEQETFALGIEEFETSQFDQAYAIDPTELKFTDAEVTVTAKATKLYKCKDWDFAAQNCTTAWSLLRSDLIPGEEYTFILTPEDPAFAEKNESAVHDAFVYEGAPNGNFDENANGLALGRYTGGNRLWTYIRFNVSNLTDPSIVNATLRLYIDSGTGSPFDFELYRVSDDSWDENTITWNSAPSAGSFIQNQTPSSVGIWMEWNVTDYVSDTLSNSSDDLISFALQGDTAATSNYGTFEDHENTKSTGNLPQLKVFTNRAPDAASVVDFPDPQSVGQDVEFVGNWTDPDSPQNISMYICKDSSCSSCNITTQSNCWCSAPVSDTNSSSCNYTVQASDPVSNSYWMSVCDGYVCDQTPLPGGTWSRQVSAPEFLVQRGAVTDTGNLTDSVEPVSVNKSFVLFLANTDDPTPDDWQFTPGINATSLTFERYDGVGVSSTVSWQVVESQDLSVQRGSESLASGTASTSVSIDQVNTSSSFVIVYGRCADETNGDNHAGFFYGNLTSSTNLDIVRGNAGKCAATVSWQVVDWSGADVQSGTTVIPDNQDSATASISGISQTSSFLVFGSASIGSDTGMDSNLIQGNISSSAQLRFTHEPGTTYSSSERRIVWYVVSPPSVSVQSGFTSFGSDTTESIDPVQVNRSFHVSSGWNTGGGQTYSNSLHTLTLVDDTTLSFDKETGGQTQNDVWYIMTYSEPLISWNQSSLSLGSGLAKDGNLSGNASILATLDHSNIVVSCESGNCSTITDDWTDGSSLSSGSSADVGFTCDNSTFGVFSATYSVKSDEDASLDTITVSCEMLDEVYVSWNQSALDLGTTTEFTGNLTGNASVFSNKANDNVNVSCSAGDCSRILDDWTDNTDMSDQQSIAVEFTCLDDTVGDFSALFDVVSSDDPIPSTINVSCSVFETNYLPQISLDSPPDLSEIFVDTTLYRPEVRLNTTVTDANDDLMCVEIFGSDSSTPSSEELLYEMCGISNNSQVSYLWTSPVRKDDPDISCLYHFDERAEYGENSTSVNDFGGECNDAVCSGISCPAFSIGLGKFAGAHHFDGLDDAWDLGSSALFDNAFTDRTVEVWFRADSISGSVPRTIYEEGGGVNGMNMYIYDGRLFAGAYCEGCTPEWNGTWINFTTSSDEWHYAALIFEGNNNMTLVYDNQSSTVAIANTMSGHGGDNFIGMNGGTKFHTGDDNSDGEYFEGYIDEFVVYDEFALSLEDARDHYRLDNGTYYWQVNASDQFGENSSSVSEFTIRLPNRPPTHTAPVLNSSLGTKSAQENLTCYNQSTFDPDSDPVKNIFNWYLNNISAAVYNLPFEGGSNSTYTQDYSGYSNSVSVYGPVWNSSSGHDGFGAYTFDGVDDYIETSSLSVDNVVGWTAMAWVYAEAESGNDNVILSQSGGDIWLARGSSSLGGGLAETLASNLGGSAFGGGNLTLDEWHHVAITIEAGSTVTRTLYLDGQAVATDNGTTPTVNDVFYLGDNQVSDNNEEWNGTIDDFMLFNYSISADQVRVFYEAEDTIDSSSTANDQQWRCCVTPTDSLLDGDELCSDSLTIVPELIEVTGLQVLPDDDEFTPGTQVNPFEAGNVSVNLTVNLTNSTVIDSCIVRVFNSTDNFLSPTFGPLEGLVTSVGSQSQCFAEWNMSYWRSAGDYNVSIDVNLTTSENTSNTTSYYYNELRAFDVNVSTIAFDSNPGLTTNSSTAYPLGVKNTGNTLLNISINGTDFIGQSNPSFTIGIQNITYNESAAGNFLALTKFLTPITSMQPVIPASTYPLYFRGYAPLGIPAQQYDSNITFRGE